MTKEVFIEDETTEALKKASDDYYQSPGTIKQSFLSILTDSDLAEIIGDKRSEWGMIEREKKIKIKGLRGDNRKILELIFLDNQEEVNKIIKSFQYIIKSRSTDGGDGFNSEDLQRAKDTISIAEVIEVLTGVKVYKGFRLIKCPLHKDNTASMKVYIKTNSFFCQGCKAGGSSIDFIKGFYNISTGEAIKQFLKFYKK